MSSLTALPGRQQQSLTALQHFHQGPRTNIHQPELPLAAGPERVRAAAPPARERTGGFGAVIAAPAGSWNKPSAPAAGLEGAGVPLPDSTAQVSAPQRCPGQPSWPGHGPGEARGAERFWWGAGDSAVVLEDERLLCLRLSPKAIH